MSAEKGNIDLSYFTAEALRVQRSAESRKLPFDSAQAKQFTSWNGYPPLAEVPEGRGWTVTSIYHRVTENIEVRRVRCDFGSALAFGGADSKPRLSKIGKLRRIEEITRPQLDLVKRRTEKGRSLDLFGSFWGKLKTNKQI